MPPLIEAHSEGPRAKSKRPNRQFPGVSLATMTDLQVALISAS